MAIIELAGLSDVVKVVIGPSSESLRRLHEDGSLQHIDMLFLDHWKPLYKTDLKICESLDLIRPGSVLIADNCVNPGNPPYLKYVRSSVAEKLERVNIKLDDSQEEFPDKVQAQYLAREGHEKTPDNQEAGNPLLEYESKMIMSHEPTGVEVSP
jgi:catechol O-methyltransferase